MKKIISSLIIAFSMFSRLPMPAADWSAENRKHVFLFFPLVGVVEGILLILIGGFLIRSGCPALITGALLTAFPIIYTGGIHMDGFLDTADAVGSCRERERRLEILKDPHVGSFAVIFGGLYLILSLAFFSAVRKEMLPVIAMSYVFSRIMSASSVILFPAAKSDGSAAGFKMDTNSGVLIGLFVWLAAAVIMSALFSLKGAGILVILGAISIGLHYRNCMCNFGGVTGDLCGAFLSCYELLVLGTVVNAW